MTTSRAQQADATKTAFPFHKGKLACLLSWVPLEDHMHTEHTAQSQGEYESGSEQQELVMQRQGSEQKDLAEHASILQDCQEMQCWWVLRTWEVPRQDQTRPNQNNNNKVNYLPNTQIKASKCSFSFKALGTASNSPKNQGISFGVNSRFEAITLKQIIL